MKARKCPYEELATYFKGLETSDISEAPESIRKHLKECSDCRKLLERPQLRDAFIKSVLNENPLRKILDNSRTLFKVEEVLPGQMWRLFYGENKEPGFAIVTSSPCQLFDKNSVRISPVYLSPHTEDIDGKTDIIARPDQVPVGITSLIEWWNDRPVLLDNLDTLYGSISAQVKKKLDKFLAEEPVNKQKSPSVQFFREVEIARGSIISADFFDYLIEKESDSQIVISDSENYDNPLIIEFDSYSADESLRMAAADFTKIFTVLKDHIRKHALPFRLMVFAGIGGKLFSESGQPFQIEIITDKPSKTLSSDEHGILMLTEKFATEAVESGLKSISFIFAKKA